MNKYIKVLSMVLALTSSVYLPSAIAASSTTDMLIEIAETNPVLIDRLDYLAVNDPKLLKKLLKLADSDPVMLEKLLNLSESDPEMFDKLVTINDVEMLEEEQISTFGTIQDGDLL